MATLSSSASHLIHHRLFRPPSPAVTSPLLSLFPFKPPTVRFQATPLSCPSSFLFSSPLSTPHPFSSSPAHFLSIHRPVLLSLHSLSNSQTVLEELDSVDPYDDGEDDSDGDFESEAEGVEEPAEMVLDSSISTRDREPASKLPSLTVKEKKELASYAHSLGKKLKSQQVGKSGVTDSVAAALVETLEANELLKLKIHGSCPGELDDVVKQLEKATGSVVVGQIGRTVILYRPSLSKLKAEEKKKQARHIFVRKQAALRPPSQNKGQVLGSPGRGRRGSSRF